VAPLGGYVVEEAHRFIGRPATFARGSAVALRDAALGLATEPGVARA
jgi:hypothetical protein